MKKRRAHPRRKNKMLTRMRRFLNWLPLGLVLVGLWMGFKREAQHGVRSGAGTTPSDKAAQ